MSHGPAARSASEGSYGQQPSVNGGPSVSARKHLNDDEAREAIRTFRSKELNKQGELFGERFKKPKEDKEVVAVTKGEPENEFGVSSKLSTYTAEDRAEANRLRDTLRQKYPELTKHVNIEEKPK